MKCWTDCVLNVSQSACQSRTECIYNSKLCSLQCPRVSYWACTKFKTEYSCYSALHSVLLSLTQSLLSAVYWRMPYKVWNSVDSMLYSVQLHSECTTERVKCFRIMHSVHRAQSASLSPEDEFLDVIGTKVLRVFLLATHSHLYSFTLRFLFLQLMQPRTVSTVQLLYTL